MDKWQASLTQNGATSQGGKLHAWRLQQRSGYWLGSSKGKLGDVSSELVHCRTAYADGNLNATPMFTIWLQEHKEIQKAN